MNKKIVSKEAGIKPELYNMLPTVFSCLRQDLVAGNYAINIIGQHLWQVDDEDAETINLGTKNGKTNVHAVICNNCKKQKASHDYNGTDDFLCTKCYDTRNGR